MYLTLGELDLGPFRGKQVRCFLAFGVGGAAHKLEARGVGVYVRTFDPFDCVMFVNGIGGGLVAEWAVSSGLQKAGSR